MAKNRKNAKVSDKGPWLGGGYLSLRQLPKKVLDELIVTDIGTPPAGKFLLGQQAYEKFVAASTRVGDGQQLLGSREKIEVTFSWNGTFFRGKLTPLQVALILTQPKGTQLHDYLTLVLDQRRVETKGWWFSNPALPFGSDLVKAAKSEMKARAAAVSLASHSAFSLRPVVPSTEVPKAKVLKSKISWPDRTDVPELNLTAMSKAASPKELGEIASWGHLIRVLADEGWNWEEFAAKHNLYRAAATSWVSNGPRFDRLAPWQWDKHDFDSNPVVVTDLGVVGKATASILVKVQGIVDLILTDPETVTAFLKENKADLLRFEAMTDLFVGQVGCAIKCTPVGLSGFLRSRVNHDEEGKVSVIPLLASGVQKPVLASAVGVEAPKGDMMAGAIVSGSAGAVAHLLVQLTQKMVVVTKVAEGISLECHPDGSLVLKADRVSVGMRVRPLKGDMRFFLPLLQLGVPPNWYKILSFEPTNGKNGNGSKDQSEAETTVEDA